MKHAKVYFSSAVKYSANLTGKCSEYECILTGTLAKEPSKKKFDIIFYCTVCGIFAGLIYDFSAFQMLSPEQDASKIRHLLPEILRPKALILRIAVSDFKRTILLKNCRSLKNHTQKYCKVFISNNADDESLDC